MYVTYKLKMKKSSNPKPRVNPVLPRKKLLPKREFLARKLDRKITSYVSLVENCGSLLKANFDLPQNLSSKGMPYISYLTKVWKDRGLATMIKTAKQSRLYVTRYLSGQPLIDESPYVKLTRDRLPAKLGSELLRIVRRGSAAEKRWLLTVLYSTRALELPLSPDYESISAPNRSEKLARIIAEMKSHSHEFWRALGLRTRCNQEKLWFKQFHLTTNMGPNGHGLWSWWTDLKCLPSTLLESLKHLGGPEFIERVSHLLNPSYSNFWTKMFPTKRQGLFRKICAIPDKEGKTRVIAIGDYFSQTVLKPFHSYLFSVLRRVRQDCTFNQGEFITKLANAKVFYSMDLSNATDRFPIDAITAVLSGHFDSNYLKAWKDVMVGYPFNKGNSQESIRYEVGNPMGFYSSWASFAVAHHFVVFLACKRLKRNWREAIYVLLGDDIVIADKDIAMEYREILTDLGVEVSVQKTHTSEHTYEFAKRWIHKGSEISPYPVGGWREVCNRYNLSVNFLQTLSAKGWVPSKGIVSVISGWATLTKKPGRFRRVIEERAAVCEIVTSVMRGDLGGVLAVNKLVQLKESRDFEYKLTDENANYIFQRACMEAFVDSNDPKNHKNGKPLGLFAETLVTIMTREDLPFMENLTWPYYVPPLNVYGGIEEMYTKLNRLAWEIDTFRGGDWPLLMRALTIPTSDVAFLTRNEHILPMASANIGKRIYDKLEEFRQIKRMYPNM